MITILQFHHAFGHIEGTVPKPTKPTAKIKWEQHDLLAQILIKNNMSDEQMVLRFLFLHTLFFFEPYFEPYLIGTTIS